MNKKSVIETKRLILRELNKEDLDDWFEIFSAENVGKFLRLYDNKEDIALLIDKKIAKFSNNLGSSYSIVEKESNKVIGSFELYVDIDNNEAKISYVINDAFGGKGYVTEAAFAVLDYAFDELRIETINGDCKEINTASIHILRDKLQMNFIKTEDGYSYYNLNKKDYKKKQL